MLSSVSKMFNGGSLARAETFHSEAVHPRQEICSEQSPSGF